MRGNKSAQFYHFVTNGTSEAACIRNILVAFQMDPPGRREGLRAVDWLPYIQPARDSEEQNMEAYVKEGQVYFRALRIIKAGEEMLVWYSKDFAQLLNIPELPRVNVNG